MSLLDRMERITERDERLSRYKEESKRIASLGLARSPENQYDRELGVYVPRSRLIGFDGMVRAGRTVDQEPLKKPKNSTFMKMTHAFTSLRRSGVDARWNVTVPEADTRVGYFCSLSYPYVAPRVTHWRAANVTNESISTGIQWGKDWEPIQDAVDFDSFNGAEEVFITTLAEHGIRAEVHEEYDDNKIIKVIFRGEGSLCSARWVWTDYAFSSKRVDAPEIGSLIIDTTPYMEMYTN